MYKITKVINNNIVSSVDASGEEILLRGLGIGFQKKTNDIVPHDKVEKVYKMENPKAANRLEELLADIPLEYITVCTDIIEYAKINLSKKLSDNIYITLTDHICFAIERQKQKLEYQNVLLMEIKRYYNAEYQIGVHALSILKEKLGIELSYDEAGFIALHIVNAELDTGMSNTYKITEFIQQVFQIMEQHYGRTFEEESMHYDRFVTHLKFFGQRLFSNKVSGVKEDDDTFYEIVRERYTFDYECAEQIGEYVLRELGKVVTEEEKMFLTIHLRRLTLSDES